MGKGHKQHPKNKYQPACMKRNRRLGNYEILSPEAWERLKKEQPDYLCSKCRDK